MFDSKVEGKTFHSQVDSARAKERLAWPNPPKVRNGSMVPDVTSWLEGDFFHEALAAPKRARQRAAGSTSFTSSLNHMPPIRTVGQTTLFPMQCARDTTLAPSSKPRTIKTPSSWPFHSTAALTPHPMLHASLRTS